MSNASRFFTVTTTVETVNGDVTHANYDYTAEQADAAIIKYHQECAYNRASDNVAYYSCGIINEFMGVEYSENYRKSIVVTPFEE